MNLQMSLTLQRRKCVESYVKSENESDTETGSEGSEKGQPANGMDESMVNDGLAPLLPIVYGSFETRIALGNEDTDSLENSMPLAPTLDLFHRSGQSSPRHEEVWNLDRDDTETLQSGKGHSKKLSSTSTISVDSGLVHDEAIVRIELPPPTREEPKFPPEKMKTLYSFLFCVFSFFLTTLTLALVHERVPDRNIVGPLPDTFLDNVPEIEWALDVSEVILVVSGLSCVLVICFHRYRFIVVRRIFFLLGILYLFRCLTMYVTVLPVASRTYYCSPKSGHASPSVVILRAVRMLVGMGLSINGQHTYCGDYIYSGHTVILTMAYLIVHEYTPRRCYILHWTAFAVTTTGVIFLMIAHGHYTVDVILAYVLTTRLFWTYHTMANNAVLKVRAPSNYFVKLWWWRTFHYFEKNIGGPLPRRYEWPLPWPKRCSAKYRDRDS